MYFDCESAMPSYNRLMKNAFKLLLLTTIGISACTAQTSPNQATIEPLSSAEISIYDQIAPPISEHMKSPSILVFSKTREWRHEDGIAGAHMHMIRLARKMGYGTFSTENGAVFNKDDLAKFSIVVMNNFTGDGLSPQQEAVLENWVKEGGGLLALHGSGDSSHKDWPWYSDEVIGPTFVSHPMDPQLQEARVEMLAPNHPIAKKIPAEWRAIEEWYTFDSVPNENFTVIAGIDESTYSPVNNVYGDVSDLRMGEGAENHPIIWSRCIGKGRTFYSAIGHMETAYDNPVYQQLLENAARWVAHETDKDGKGC